MRSPKSCALADIVTFGCPECGGKLTVPLMKLGVKGPCPLCRREIAAPRQPPPEIPLSAPASFSNGNWHGRPCQKRNPGQAPAVWAPPAGTRSGRNIPTRVPEATHPAPPRIGARRRGKLPIRREGGPMVAGLNILNERGLAGFGPDPNGRTPLRDAKPAAGRTTVGREPAGRAGAATEPARTRRAGGSGSRMNRWRVMGAVMGGLLVVAVLAGIHFYRMATVFSKLGTMPGGHAPASTAIPDRREILQCLRAFHEAETPEGKAPYVDGGQERLRQLQAYYAQRSIEPIGYAVEPDLAFYEQDGEAFARGRGHYASSEPFEFVFRKRGTRWFLDWDAFAEVNLAME